MVFRFCLYFDSSLYDDGPACILHVRIASDFFWLFFFSAYFYFFCWYYVLMGLWMIQDNVFLFDFDVVLRLGYGYIWLLWGQQVLPRYWQVSNYPNPYRDIYNQPSLNIRSQRFLYIHGSTIDYILGTIQHSRVFCMYICTYVLTAITDIYSLPRNSRKSLLILFSGPLRRKSRCEFTLFADLVASQVEKDGDRD